MLHLARKAFFPVAAAVSAAARRHDLEVPRDVRVPRRMARESGMELLVHHNPEAERLGINPFTHGSSLHTDMWKTQGLKQALDKYGFDVAFGGARRDEEKSRAKERMFSFRTRAAPLGPEEPAARTLAPLQRAQEPRREHPRVPALELDRARHLAIHRAARTSRIVPLYFAAERPGRRARRHADHGRRRAHAARAPARSPRMRRVRFRTLGCYPLTGAVESRRRHAAGDHPGDAARAHVRAAGPRHRPRFERVDGKEEAGRLLLMHAERRIADRCRRSPTPRTRQKDLLRFITCGSVDDGKSTLIGRLLYESKALLEDQLAALEADSKKFGTQGDELDFALLVDGLSAEREQGITIDVAYRFFSTEKRKFIVADTPGHEQYTRNMVTGASTADLAVILIDARKGVLTQTRRHSYLVSLLGIGTSCWRSTRWTSSATRARCSTSSIATTASSPTKLGFEAIVSIPMSALRRRQHASARSANTPWYTGPTLMAASRNGRDRAARTRARRSACRCNGSTGRTSDFRGFSGRMLGGSVQARRRGPRAAVGQAVEGRAHRHAGRRSRRGRRRPVGHADARRRDRHQPRRRDLRGRRSAPASPTSSRRASSG